MKGKIYFICVAVIMVVCCFGCNQKKIHIIKNIPKDDEVQSVEIDELRSSFWHWDTTEITVREKNEIMKQFTFYLERHTRITESELEKFSKHFTVMDQGEFRIISFMEDVENWGIDGRKRFSWIVADYGVAPIIECECRKVDYVIQDAQFPYMYYLIGTEDQFPSQSGVFVYALYIKEPYIQVVKEIFDAKPEGDFVFKDYGIYGSQNVKIEKIGKDARSLIVKSGKETMTLMLCKDKYYRNKKMCNNFYSIDVVILREQIKSWTTDRIGSGVKAKVIQKLGIYLNCYASDSDEMFGTISDQLNFMHEGKLRLITYRENADIYGEQEGESFCWITDENGNMSTLYLFDTKQIQKIEQDEENENTYFLYGKGYGISSDGKDYLWKVTLQKDTIEIKQIQ